MTDVESFVAGEETHRRLSVLIETDVEITCRQNSMHSRYLKGSGGINPIDSRMGIGTADDAGMEQARNLYVSGENFPSRKLGRGVEAASTLSNCRVGGGHR
jgi:hypothetical protein